MKPSRELVAGFIQWLSVAIGALGGYAITLSGFAEWDWFPVFCGAMFQTAAGLAALSLHLKKGTKPLPEVDQPPVDPEPETLFKPADYGDEIIDLGPQK